MAELFQKWFLYLIFSLFYKHFIIFFLIFSLMIFLFQWLASMMIKMISLTTLVSRILKIFENSGLALADELKTDLFLNSFSSILFQNIEPHSFFLVWHLGVSDFGWDLWSKIESFLRFFSSNFRNYRLKKNSFIFEALFCSCKVFQFAENSEFFLSLLVISGFLIVLSRSSNYNSASRRYFSDFSSNFHWGYLLLLLKMLFENLWSFYHWKFGFQQN